MMLDTRILLIALFAAITLTAVPSVQSAKILGVALAPGRSHFIVHDSLLRGLAAKGHDVTVLGNVPAPTETIPNYTYIKMELDEELTAEFESVKKGMVKSADENNAKKIDWNMMKSLHRTNVAYLKHPILEKLKREAQFDLLVLGWFLNDYSLGIGAHFKCPIVVISGMPALKPLRDMIGNPISAAYNDFSMSSGEEGMTFMQRIINHGMVAFEFVAFNVLEYFIFEPVYSEHFPPSHYPSLAEVKKNVSLVMVSTHFSQAAPMATFPGLLEVSGIQIKKTPNPLPADIRTFLDGAKDGAIFFSFGSNIDSTYISEEKRKIILKVLGKLKQRVLWKWEDDKLPGQPPNVMIGKWLPQDDVLAHPNVKLFISHCGKGSINEAQFHGVPILAMPIFGDQSKNADAIEQEGWAVQLQFGDITEENFERALKQMLDNPKYSEVVKKAADLYKDRPEHPLDLAVYWTEYVLRHDGARHMQSQAVHLNWFQKNSFDVFAALAVVAWISWRLIVCLVKFVYGKCFGRKKSAGTTAEKTKKKVQ